MKETIKKLSVDASELLINIGIALLILVVGYRLINWFERSLRKEHKLSEMDKTAKSFIISFITIGLKIILVFIALTIVGIPTASLITVIGSCAVAIGLALQGGLSNIAGGLMILIFKPFKIGDYIRVDSLEGIVKSINMFYTSITTLDNKVIQLPNGNLSNSNIINYYYNDKRRIDLEFNVSYDTKITDVKKVVNEIIKNNKYILQDEKNDIRLSKHDSSSLTFLLRAWINKEDYWNTYFDLMEEVKEKFDKNNISIPYPQLDVHIKNK